MTATYKTKIKVAQQYQQTVHLMKQVSQHQQEALDALKVFPDCASAGPYVVPPPCFLSPSYSEGVKIIPAMSTEWKSLPFAYPVTEDNKERASNINEILNFSLRQQKEDEVSDNAGFVVILVSRCLKAVGIDNLIDAGYRHLKGELIPHMWLVIEGYVIDNTYIKELQDNGTKYLCKNTPKCYQSYDFSYPEACKSNQKLKTKLNTLKITNNILKQFIYFCTRKPDRALALGLNREQSFNYYFTMIRHMYEVYGICIIGIDPKIRFMCWWCERYPKPGRNFLSNIVRQYDLKETNTSSRTTWKFQHCSQCMVANYCSLDCQRSDWIENHSVTCFSRGSVYLPPI